ncbi:MAG: helix-turn-helix domain-containing protein [Clostridia bacterium]
MLTDKEIGEKIKKLRNGNGYTQEELSEKLLIGDRIKISRIENGKQSMTANELIKFCSFFNISLDVLLNDEKLNSEEYLILSDRYLTNDDIEIEEKREVINKIYIKLANSELNSILMYSNLNKNNKNNKKLSKSTIEKYEINSTM